MGAILNNPMSTLALLKLLFKNIKKITFIPHLSATEKQAQNGTEFYDGKWENILIYVMCVWIK